MILFGSLSLPLVEVAEERTRQDQKWGEQNHPDGEREDDYMERLVRADVEAHAALGALSWRDVLEEEITEAFVAIGNDQRLREELIQVAAVAVAWVEAIDRRQR